MAAWEQGRAPDPSAVWVDRGPWVAGAARHLHVRHAGWTWLEEVPEAALHAAEASELRTAAMRYLASLAPFAPELHGVLARLAAGGPFGWLPLKWALDEQPPADRDARASFVLARRQRTGTAAGDWLDGQLVLLAGHRMPGHGLALGDGVGLRVTASIGAQAEGRRALRFTSLNATRPDEILDALPAWIPDLCAARPGDDLRRRLAQALDLAHPAVHAIRKEAGSDRWVLLGSGTRVRQRLPNDPPRHRPRTPAFEFEVEVAPPGQVVAIRRLEEPGARMTEDEGAVVRLFERDPASQAGAAALAGVRPGSPGDVLDRFRDYAAQSPRAMRVGPALSTYDDRFFVSHERTSPAYSEQNPDSSTGRKIARLPGRAAGTAWRRWLPLRSDDLAAAQAYIRAREFFDRLQTYGLEAACCFRHAELPLELRARARLPGAADGHTLNANVRPYFRNAEAVPADLLSPAAAGGRSRRPNLVVRFGSADAAVTSAADVPARAGASEDTNRQRPRAVASGRQTLGLAADPRWAWHEFAHVLNYAATGELELPFAHSAGDALAAIAADPDSRLAADEAARGMTFPWAFVPRRHDRAARRGYCWCGRRLAALQGATAAWAGYRHGYFAEQLLSSSLFRLYLAIGGGTGAPAPRADATGAEPADDPDIHVRRSASDYCVYLVMRAIALLGPNGVAPALSPDQFVGALVDADLGTGAWAIEARWPYREADVPLDPRRVVRQGGRVHKVIRWAFEQQGLYAAGAGEGDREGPGLPPPVDFYIADRRRSPGGEEGRGGDGGYWPVPLRQPVEPGAAWLAAPDALEVRSNGEVRVQVRQRGRQQAPLSEARVALWAGREVDGRLQWKRCKATGPGRFATGRPERAGGGWWLASVDHPADRSNLGDGSPPADFGALVELVANDNNLALAPMR